MTDPSSAPPPRFFADRCLGKVTVDRLRDLGWDIVRLSEVFPGDGQTISDETLLDYAAQQGWPVLTKDKRIRYQSSFHHAGTPVFAVSSGDLTIDRLVERFDAARRRIWEVAATPDGQFWIIYDKGRIERRA